MLAFSCIKFIPQQVPASKNTLFDQSICFDRPSENTVYRKFINDASARDIRKRGGFSITKKIKPSMKRVYF